MQFWVCPLSKNWSVLSLLQSVNKALTYSLIAGNKMHGYRAYNLQFSVTGTHELEEFGDPKHSFIQNIWLDFLKWKYYGISAKVFHDVYSYITLNT